MEGAYGTAALAVSRLISSSEEESQYPESFGLLRSVLRRRPVVLGFVVSILAEKLQGTEACMRKLVCCNGRRARILPI